MTHFITDTLAACDYWQVAAPNRPGEIAPVTSAIPTMLLVGTFDATTPPSFSRPAAERLSHSHYYELPIGHGAIVTECGLDLIQQFFANPTQTPDSRCIDAMTINWVLPE
jgi:pimeloyl-ACP methyl ester carboxylesterase